MGVFIISPSDKVRVVPFVLEAHPAAAQHRHCDFRAAEPGPRHGWIRHARIVSARVRRVKQADFMLDCAMEIRNLRLAMANEWDIKSRSERCAVTNREFQEGEVFYALLYFDREGFRREDLSEEAWKARNENIQPFSFWRSTFEPPPPPEAEPLAKETAEDLLRRYMNETDAGHANARYVLALMLERKRLLRELEVKSSSEGKMRIYEHVKTGEVFVVPDPELRLDQIGRVQQEVSALLG